MDVCLEVGRTASRGAEVQREESTTPGLNNAFKSDAVESETEEELMWLHAKFHVIFTILSTDLSSCIINHLQDCLQTADRCTCTSICREHARELGGVFPCCNTANMY